MNPLRRTQELGTEFWNDSCSPRELAEAVALGAVGATSNPVIVSAVVKAEQAALFPVLDRLIADHREAAEDDIAWLLIEELGRRAAALLLPAFERSGGRAGFLSMQVNPKFHRDPDRMIEHGKRLAALAPNIAIKAPCTEAGLAALEGLTAAGIRINATVSFSVPQAIAAAEAVERGLKKRSHATHRPDITIMVGRLDDHLQRIQAKEGTAIEPGFLNWAGIIIFKKAWREFQERGFGSRLLVAAYRHHLHWSELIGPDVAQTIPYVWWKRFEASGLEPQRTIDRAVDPKITEALLRAFPDFARAYGELAVSEFDAFGPTLHTLDQFLSGYQELITIVRARMLREF